MHRVAKAHRAHALYLKLRQTLVDSDDDDGPEDDDAWLYEDLKVLGFLYSRLRDREQLIDLIFEVCVCLLYLPRLRSAGCNIGPPQGHAHHLLFASRTGIPGSQHCRFIGRSPVVHQRSHKDCGTNRRA